jgi:hypothetical protein
MPKISDEPLEFVKVRLFQRDLIQLKRTYGATIGINKAIRTIIRSHVIALNAEVIRQIDVIERSPEGPSSPSTSIPELPHG